MIKSITISNIATFAKAKESLTDLSKFNFLFGSNGSGKTTIGRVIADEGKFPSCLVTWEAGRKLQPLVYNVDFIACNFNQSEELQGIFTLGESQIDAKAKIQAKKDDLEKLKKKESSLLQQLDGAEGQPGKNAELAKLEDEFKGKCWDQKRKHDAKLQGGFEGFRNSAERFRDKILQELRANTASLLTLAELENRAATILSRTGSFDHFPDRLI